VLLVAGAGDSQIFEGVSLMGEALGRREASRAPSIPESKKFSNIIRPKMKIGLFEVAAGATLALAMAYDYSRVVDLDEQSALDQEWQGIVDEWAGLNALEWGNMAVIAGVCAYPVVSMCTLSGLVLPSVALEQFYGRVLSLLVNHRVLFPKEGMAEML